MLNDDYKFYSECDVRNNKKSLIKWYDQTISQLQRQIEEVERSKRRFIKICEGKDDTSTSPHNIVEWMVSGLLGMLQNIRVDNAMTYAANMAKAAEAVKVLEKINTKNNN